MSDKKLGKDELLVGIAEIEYYARARFGGERLNQNLEQALSQIKEIIEQHFGGKNERTEQR